MKKALLAATPIAVAALCGTPGAQAPSPPAPQQVEFVPLFDGRTLAGFEQKGGKAKYRVESDAIVGTSVPSTPNSFLCTTRHYGDFELEYEFLVDGNLNSGVQIRSHSRPGRPGGPDGPGGPGRPGGRVHGYQVEIDPDVKRNRMWTGGIYDESRRGWLHDLSKNAPARKAFKPNQWNRMRVHAEGDSIKTWINGIPAADLVDSMTLSGFIGLQVHGVGKREDPLQVRWRNLRIKDLGRHVWHRIFDGSTTDGWQAAGGGSWEVVDGILVGKNAKSEPRHGQLFFATEYADCTVRLRFKAVVGNSGLYFRAERRDGGVGIAGMQAEIDAVKDAGGLYETGGRQWLAKPAAKFLQKHFRPGEWNELTVSAHGRRIVVHLNGHQSAALPDDPGRTRGALALQIHGGQDVEVHFKDIELLVKDGK